MTKTSKLLLQCILALLFSWLMLPKHMSFIGAFLCGLAFNLPVAFIIHVFIPLKPRKPERHCNICGTNLGYTFDYRNQSHADWECDRVLALRISSLEKRLQELNAKGQAKL